MGNTGILLKRMRMPVSLKCQKSVGGISGSGFESTKGLVSRGV